MLIQNYGHKCFFLGLHKLWLTVIAISLWGALRVGDLGGCFLWGDRKKRVYENGCKLNLIVWVGGGSRILCCYKCYNFREHKNKKTATLIEHHGPIFILSVF